MPKLNPCHQPKPETVAAGMCWLKYSPPTRDIGQVMLLQTSSPIFMPGPMGWKLTLLAVSVNFSCCVPMLWQSQVTLQMPAMTQPQLFPGSPQQPLSTPEAPPAPEPNSHSDSHQQDVRHGFPCVMASAPPAPRPDMGHSPCQSDPIKALAPVLRHFCSCFQVLI